MEITTFHKADIDGLAAWRLVDYLFDFCFCADANLSLYRLNSAVATCFLHLGVLECVFRNEIRGSKKDICGFVSKAPLLTR